MMKALSPGSFQLPDRVRAQLRGCVEREQFAAAFDLLRQQRLPFAACGARRPDSLAPGMFTAVRQLAAVSLPMTIGLVMHLYPLCALRTFPLGIVSWKRLQRALYLRRICRERLLIANVGGHRDAGGRCLRRAVRTRDGYALSGSAPFLSLATVADYAVVSAALSDKEDGVFALRLRPLPEGLTFSPPRFGELMNASCTRRADFDAVTLPRGALIFRADHSPLCQRLFALQRAWLHFLTAAAYLGASEHAIQRLCPDQTAELHRHLATAFQACRLLAHTLTEKRRSWRPLAQLEELSAFAKYIATDAAAVCLGRIQDLVNPALQADLVRARAEILLGAQHPPHNRQIESRMLALVSV